MLLEDSNPLPRGTYWRCYACAFLCGVLNNNGYCIVVAAAQDLSGYFKASDLMTAFNLILLVACIIATMINGRFLVSLQPRLRIVAVLTGLTLAYALLAVSTFFPSLTGFGLALIASVFAGACQSIGECTNLAFLKSFPPALLGAWGAGTGVSGLAGPGLYLLLSNLHVDDKIIFLCLIPTSVIYFVCFMYMDRVANAHALNASVQQTATKENEETAPLLAKEEPKSHQEVMTIAAVAEVFKYAGAVILYMTVVYFAEYSIYPSLVDRDSHFVANPNSFIQTNVYVLSWMCYNVGVTISRLSISVIRIRSVWVLSMLQVINLALWFVEAITHYLRDVYGDGGYAIMLVWMVWVGLMGGGTYANCMHIMNTSPDIPDRLRELGVNVCFCLLNLGIIVSSVLFLGLDNSVLKLSKLYPDANVTDFT